MNTFKRKSLMAAAIAVLGLVLAGCAGDQAYLRAQAEAATAASNARVAEAQAESDKAKAVIAVSAKLDAGGAAAYVLGLSFKGMAGAGAPAAVQVQRPRDWLDYLNGVTGILGVVANAAVPIITVRENGKSQRAGYDRDVAVETQRQSGETARIQSVAAIGAQVASSQPQANVTYTLSGTGVLGSGTYTGPVTTTTTTTRNCSGGAGAAGGSGTTGNAGGGGASTGGSC